MKPTQINRCEGSSLFKRRKPATRNLTNTQEASSELLQAMVIQAITKLQQLESELCSLTPRTKGVWAAQLGRLSFLHCATGSSCEHFRGQQKAPACGAVLSHHSLLSPEDTEPVQEIYNHNTSVVPSDHWWSLLHRRDDRNPHQIRPQVGSSTKEKSQSPGSISRSHSQDLDWNPGHLS